ncbi:MAG: EamA family transporter [Candidatus Zixiibacteriota bacterium]
MNTLVYSVLCLIWGSTWLAIKIGLSQAPPLTTASLRFLLASLTLSCISLVRRHTYPGSLRELLRLGYPGIYMFGLSYALVYLGQLYVNSATAAVLFASFPFFIAALNWWLNRSERLSPRGWLGMVLGFGGVVAISYDSLQTSGDIFLGSLAVLAAALVSAYGVVLHKKRFGDVNIVVAANVQMISGGILLLIAACLAESWADFHVTAKAVGSIIYLALGGSVVAFLGYFWLVKRMRLTVVSLIAFITPLVAILIGVLVAEESITAMESAGAGLILCGVLLVIRA